MEARRSRIVAAGMALGLLGAAIPIIAMAWMSWTIALQKEQDALALFAERALARAQATFEDARSALTAIAATPFEPCSPQHVARMRTLTIDTLSVEEMGYFGDDGVLRCTSWGPAEGDVGKAGIDYVTPDGLEVSLRVAPAVSRGATVTALHLGNHNVLVSPARFVDILTDEGVSIALTNARGTLINAVNGEGLPRVLPPLGETGAGMAGDTVFAVARGEGLAAVATRPSSGLVSGLRDELAFLLPVGAFIAAFIVGIVVWLSRKRLEPRAELALAVQNREFVVHYQPIVALATGICVGAEALVRWRRPDGTLVRPDLFIPLAEETGLIMPITDQVIDAVIADLGSTLVADRTLHIAVNLSAADISSGRFLDVVARKLAPTGIRPEQLWLEATERGFIDIEAARVNLARARQAGHSVAIDDFGTGYSSLQYLEGLPMDALKIDKSFIDTVGKDTATSSVTLHIIDMARELGLFTVAEGIETAEQAEYLKARGVDFGQGWLFAKPLPPTEFAAYHERSRRIHGPAPEVIRVAAA
ncbi:signal peptide protein [Devosia geojensis]|uniref:cyclic-guanylate-specific phosphodiesterase n=1 Tax=Devosia geojensis TaxID=443610 RepID=A0A0F5FXT8_9HYPH|nr:EAL domain-containing protein [Devosia geojensis]KKB13691.1 signal peptide protein [Devosia geojensis]